jgi:methyl-accepting chemotaxis protein
MRVGTSFAAAMAAIGLVVVLLDAEPVVDRASDWRAKDAAIADVRALGAALGLDEMIPLERGATNQAMTASGEAAPLRAKLEAQRARFDAASQALRTALIAAGLADDTMLKMLTTTGDEVAASRREVDGALAQPLAARVPALEAFNRTSLQLHGQLAPLLNRVELATSHADPSVATMISLARQGADMRESGGQQATRLVSAAGAGRQLTEEDVDRIAAMGGRIDSLREQVLNGIAQAGSPPALVEAEKTAGQAYFQEARATTAQQVAAGRQGSSYPLSSSDFVSKLIPALQTLLGVRDAALSEAEALAMRSRDKALYSLLLQCGLAAAALAIVVGAGVTFRRHVLAPLAALTGTVTTLAGGTRDLAVPYLRREDELGRMAEAIEQLRRGAIEADDAAAQQDRERQQRENRAQRIETMTHDFDSSVSSILGAVAQAGADMQETASSMSATAEQTTHQASIVASAAEEASTNVQTVASASEELASSIQEISRQVHQSTQVASNAAEQSAKTNVLMLGLAQSAQRIGDVVKLINNIASQTNLLALNATIEAARAGEAGKGFAVVANEVKTLANQTGKATDEIAQQVAAVQAATEEAVQAIQDIGQTISEINEISTAIASAVEEQGAATQEIARNVQRAAEGTEQVTQNIGGVSGAATETGHSAHSVLNAATGLARESDALRRVVDGFLKDVRAA